MGNRIYLGQAVKGLERMMADGVVASMCVTSPPYYGLRDYGSSGQIGLEASPGEYIAALVGVFARVRDVLADDGTLWVNIGDSYSGYYGNKEAKYEDAPSNKGGYFENQRESTVGRHGLKQKDLIGIPWMLAFALRADGWYLRQDIVWHKPNPMPESVTDRCTKAHEYIFLLSKKPRYYYNHEAVMEAAVTPASSSANDLARNGALPEIPGQGYAQHRASRHPVGGVKHANGEEMSRTKSGKDWDNTGMRNKRSVWTVATKPYKGAHFAVFPEALVTPCILAGCPPGGIVLDPFMGSGTTAAVAFNNGRGFAGCELNAGYRPLQEARLGMFASQCEWVHV
jgi:DNA modification methylase